MQNIPHENGDPNQSDNLRQYLIDRFEVEDVVPNIDTLILFSRLLPNGIRRLDELMGKRTEIKPNEHGYVTILQQPNEEGLDWLARKQEELAEGPWMFRLHLSRADIGLEFVTGNPHSAQELHSHQSRYIKLRWKRGAEVTSEYTTTYWNQSEANRNLACYADKSSRSPAHHDRPCCRLELRLRREALKANELTNISALLKLDPCSIFEKHVRWANKDRVDRLIRRHVSRMLGDYAQRRSHEIVGDYRNRSYLNRRYEGFWFRYGYPEQVAWDLRELVSPLKHKNK